MGDTQTQDRPTAEDVAAGTQALERVAPEAARARELGHTTDAITGMTDHELGMAWKTARALDASGFFKDVKGAGQAFAKILLGRDLGLSPYEAMQNLHIIEGKVEASGNFHAVRVRQHEHYDYSVAALTPERCEIVFTHDGDEIGRSEFTIEDAKLAGLESRGGRNGEPGNYKKFPRNMLFNRAMTNGVAWFCPEVMGSIRVYAPGEIDEGTSLAAVVDERTGEPGFDWTSLKVSDELRDRLRRAIERANELAPGEWPVAKVEMTFTGRSEKQVETITRQIEKLIEEAESEQPVDAEVVPDEEAATAEKALDEDLAGGPVDVGPADEGTQEHVAALRKRVEDLEERLPTAQSDREQEELQAELDKVQGELRAIVGDDGQATLDVE